jgi:hypothetical protein
MRLREVIFDDKIWTLKIQGKKVTSRMSDQVVEHIYGEDNFWRWEANERMVVETYQKVNWDACGKAMEPLNISRRQWLTKHVAGHAGIGTRMVQWGK